MDGATGRLFYYLCCSCVFVVRLCIPTVSFLKYEVNVGRYNEAWQMEKGLWTCQEVTVFRSLFHEVLTITRDISCKSPVRVMIAFLRKSSHDLRQIYVVYFCIISKGFVRYLLISVFLSSFIVSFDCSLFDLIFDASFEKCSLPFGDPVILKSHALG